MRWGPARLLTVVGLLAGVFAMHGLTGNHDATIALPHGMASLANVATADHVHTTAATRPSAVHPPLAAQIGVTVGAVDESGHHAMDVCLAVLTALALAAWVVLAAVRRKAALSVGRGAPVHRLRLPSRSPPWLQPSLSKLCVLRT
ncbi:hypothetical protein GCM10009789_62670 [Kribbella sancticallisti]|uniref:Uncharacterized protein n=1 Tax=Kribbella sancticallisti TaxID=460087 RepID=A0ABN2E9Y0_9ACTN